MGKAIVELHFFAYLLSNEVILNKVNQNLNRPQFAACLHIFISSAQKTLKFGLIFCIVLLYS